MSTCHIVGNHMLRLIYTYHLLQDACQILMERLEPTRKDNPNVSWKDLVSSNYYPMLFKQIVNMESCCITLLSQCMRFPTMWYVRPVKAQISLSKRAAKETAEARPSLHLSKYHIVGNYVSWLNCVQR